MADIEFGDFRDRGESGDVAIGQAVASGDDEAEGFGVRRGRSDALDLGCGSLFAFAVSGTGAERHFSILGGAKLDLLGTGTLCGVDLFDIWVDKDAYENTGSFESFGG